MYLCLNRLFNNTKEKELNVFCNRCGLDIPDNYRFCPKCGAEIVQIQNTENENEKPTLHCGDCSETFSDEATLRTHYINKHLDKDDDRSESNPGTYQKLALIGGIFGIVLTPIIAFSAGILLAIGSAFSPSSINPEESAQLTMIATFVSIIVSIIGIIIAYLIKKPKNVGIILIFLGIAEMFGTMFVYGIITWVLFIVAGIIAVQKKY